MMARPSDPPITSFNLSSLSLVQDLQLFKAIKEWEILTFKKLDEKNQTLYLRGLNFKIDRLKTEYERIPSSFSYQSK